jgi:hypothetical protein
MSLGRTSRQRPTSQGPEEDLLAAMAPQPTFSLVEIVLAQPSIPFVCGTKMASGEFHGSI